MNGLTERLCHSLLAIPEEDAIEHGARFIERAWSRFGKSARDAFRSASAASPQGLTATDVCGTQLAVDSAAFNNAFGFASNECRHERSREAVSPERICWAAPVFAATALAEARRQTYRRLCHAVGLGMEAYGRLAASLGSSSARRNFEPHVLAAPLAAIVACGAVEDLPPVKIARALGLGCSALTGVTSGYLPLQIAMAARDGIVMILLVDCEFGAPPDVLACRWGVYETFADAADMNSLRCDSDLTPGDDDLRRLIPDWTEEDRIRNTMNGSMPVHQVMGSLFR